MWLVAGLGNPGPKYENTRHNIGFLVETALRDRADAGTPRDKFGAAIAEGRLHDQRVTFMRPMEYMNLSGQAVGKAAKFWKVAPHDLVVIHDDVDLPFGRLKVGAGGGSGGHNGIKSIIDHLGSKDFNRVRVGVGRPTGGRDTAGHVLARFSSEQAEALADVVNTAADAVEAIMRDGLARAMNTYNGAGKADPPKAAED